LHKRSAEESAVFPGLLRLPVLFGLVSTCVPASADIVYSTFGPGDSFNSRVVQWIGDGAAAGATFDDRQVANRFTVPTDFEVTSYRVAISHFSGPVYHGDGAGILSLWSGAAFPEIQLESGIAFNTGNGTAQIVDIPSVFHPLLMPGQTYWLTLSAPDQDLFRWYYSDQPVQPGWEIRDREGAGAWNSAGNTANAFEVGGIAGGVPEPQPWILIATAAALIALSRLRLRRT
jgi:hypothetical protein